MAKSDDSTAHTRRSFFREALSRLAQPVAEFVDAQIGAYIPTEKGIAASHQGQFPKMIS